MCPNPKKRGGNTSQFSVRVSQDVGDSLKILHSIDKRIHGSMSFNDYMAYHVIGKFLEIRERDLDIVRKAIEAEELDGKSRL